MTNIASAAVNNTKVVDAKASGQNALSAQLNQVDFLRLMTEQLRQQDPTNPADSSQMVVQMAQMSSASGIIQLTQMMGELTSGLTAQTRVLERIEAATSAALQNKGE